MMHRTSKYITSTGLEFLVKISVTLSASFFYKFSLLPKELCSNRLPPGNKCCLGWKAVVRWLISNTNHQHKNTYISLSRNEIMHGLATSASEREGVEGRLDTKSWVCLSLLLSKQQEKWENCHCVPLSPNLKVAKSLHAFPLSKNCCYQSDFPIA